VKYRETQPPDFQKQTYNRFYGKEGLGVNDLSRWLNWWAVQGSPISRLCQVGTGLLSFSFYFFQLSALCLPRREAWFAPGSSLESVSSSYVWDAPVTHQDQGVADRRRVSIWRPWHIRAPEIPQCPTTVHADGSQIVWLSQREEHLSLV